MPRQSFTPQKSLSCRVAGVVSTLLRYDDDDDRFQFGTPSALRLTCGHKSIQLSILPISILPFRLVDTGKHLSHRLNLHIVNYNPFAALWMVPPPCPKTALKALFSSSGMPLFFCVPVGPVNILLDSTIPTGFLPLPTSTHLSSQLSKFVAVQQGRRTV